MNLVKGHVYRNVEMVDRFAVITQDVSESVVYTEMDLGGGDWWGGQTATVQEFEKAWQTTANDNIYDE